jgi:hypothetical protein
MPSWETVFRIPYLYCGKSLELLIQSDTRGGWRVVRQNISNRIVFTDVIASGKQECQIVANMIAVVLS